MSMMAAAVPSGAAPLPQRLMTFFAKYPPKLYSAQYTCITIPLTRLTKKEKQFDQSSAPESLGASFSPAPTTSPDDPNAAQVEPISTAPPETSAYALRNPFMPWKNHTTGKWQGPTYGLRRQAELVKIAKTHGLEPLLPPGRKSTVFKEQKALERGLRVKGTGAGQNVKGHKWERTMSATVEKRRKAMEEMPEMIRLWKQRGHGRGWKKYPR